MLASVRRMGPSRLGVRGLLAAPLTLSLALSGAALAEGAATDECGRVELFLDDQPAPRCAVLFGDEDARARNESWRSGHIMAVESGSRTLDVLHTDAQLRQPKVRSLSGMVVREVFDAELEERCADPEAQDDLDEGDEDELELGDAGPDAEEDTTPEPQAEVARERVARVKLSESWASLCGQDSVVVRVDDSLGERGRVLHIDRRGLLTHLGGQLVWLGRVGAEAPVFRTTWQSSFSVSTETVSKPAPQSNQRKRPPNRNRRSSRRR